MSEKIIARYLDKEVEISMKHLLCIVFQIEGREYRIQREQNGEELNISVNSQLVIHPRASNMIWIKEENW